MTFLVRKCSLKFELETKTKGGVEFSFVNVNRISLCKNENPIQLKTNEFNGCGTAT